MRISDWSSDVCSSDLVRLRFNGPTTDHHLGHCPGLSFLRRAAAYLCNARRAKGQARICNGCRRDADSEIPRRVSEEGAARQKINAGTAPPCDKRNAGEPEIGRANV